MGKKKELKVIRKIERIVKKMPHKHLWQAISKENDVFVRKTCFFVCECGVYKIKRMKNFS